MDSKDMGTAYRKEDEDDAFSVTGEAATAADEDDEKCLWRRLNATTEWNFFPVERHILRSEV